jgi:cytoskeletal protein RodZ
METPGIMLKREREARGLTIKYIASETKISESSIAAIEDNNFNAFPAEVFVRGFLRNYARALALPSEEIILAYESYKNQTSQTPEHVSVADTVQDAISAEKAANNNDEAIASHSFRFAYLAIILLVVASIGLSVVFTGTGEAEESNGYYPEASQDEEESPFLISNTSDGWLQ